MLLITHEDIEDDVDTGHRITCVLAAKIEKVITEVFGAENCTGTYGTMKEEDNDPNKFNL